MRYMWLRRYEIRLHGQVVSQSCHNAFVLMQAYAHRIQRVTVWLGLLLQARRRKGCEDSLSCTVLTHAPCGEMPVCCTCYGLY